MPWLQLQRDLSVWGRERSAILLGRRRGSVLINTNDDGNADNDDQLCNTILLQGTWKIDFGYNKYHWSRAWQILSILASCSACLKRQWQGQWWCIFIDKQLYWLTASPPDGNGIWWEMGGTVIIDSWWLTSGCGIAFLVTEGHAIVPRVGGSGSHANT